MTKRTRWEIIILLCMYLGYMSFMVCRNTVIVASPDLIADPTLNMDEGSYGRLMSFHSIGGVVGKVFTGLAVDRWGGRTIFLLMLALTSVTTAGFGMVSQFSSMAGLNMLGQAAKSGGWPAMAAIIRDWYPPEKHGRIWGVISTSSRVGVMTATLFLGHLLSSGVAWRTLFWVSAGIGTAMMALGLVFLRSGPKDVGLSPPTSEGFEDHSVEDDHPLKDHTFSKALKVFFFSSRVWLISLTMVFTTMMMDFLNFIPLYLSQSLGLSSGSAGKAGTAFPAGCFIAVLGAGFLYDRLSTRGRVIVIGGLLGSGLLSILTLWSLPDWGLGPDRAYWYSVVAIFWFGCAVAPAYYLPMSVFSIRFGGPFCGFLICLLDIFGYAGATVFNYYGGTVVLQYGWNGFLTCLAAITLTATTLLLGFLTLEHRRSTNLV